MALLAPIATLHGFRFEDAYHRITRFDVEFPEYIEIQIDVFPDRDARLANRVPIHRYTVDSRAANLDAAILRGGSLLAGLYETVKATLNVSADA